MKIRIELLSDTILGSGNSIPGGEDIAVLTDQQGFPYMKASTFKGILREETENYILWSGEDPTLLKRMFGGNSKGDANGICEEDMEHRMHFSDFVLPSCLRAIIAEETKNKQENTDSLTTLRTFTKIDDKNSTVAEGSLRNARCVLAGVTLEGEIDCKEEEEPIVVQVLRCIKWIGTMRSRGFGRVKVERVE